MPHSMWKGTLTFGLVSVPVKLYSAVVSRSVRFHQLHATDHARIVQRRFCSAEGEEVPFEEIVKGYEIAPGRHVVIEPEEFAALEPAFTRSIEIEDFVQLDEIDPILFDRPYFLAPSRGGARPYRLLLEAMRDTGKVAIGRVVLRSRQQLVAVHPRGGLLLMTTLVFADEIQRTSELGELREAEEVELGAHELDVAVRLIESIARPFDPANYHDTYREALLELIDRKAGGEQVVLEPPVHDEPLQAADLMSALEASLAQVRARRDQDEAAFAGSSADESGNGRRGAGRRAKAAGAGAKKAAGASAAKKAPETAPAAKKAPRKAAAAKKPQPQPQGR
jgi:DNA end-binding protein Ku